MLDRPRSGRPRVTSPQEDRFIRLSHHRHRFQPATLTAATHPGRQGNRINAQTVRRRLHALGLRSRFAYRGMLLTAATSRKVPVGYYACSSTCGKRVYGLSGSQPNRDFALAGLFTRSVTDRTRLGRPGSSNPLETPPSVYRTRTTPGPRRGVTSYTESSNTAACDISEAQMYCSYQC